MAPPPNQDDASEFELAIDDDLLAAAVAAVEARMAPRPKARATPDPEAEAAFAADLEIEFEDDGFDGPPAGGGDNGPSPAAPGDATAFAEDGPAEAAAFAEDDLEDDLDVGFEGDDAIGIDLGVDHGVDHGAGGPAGAAGAGTLDVLLAALTESRAAHAAAEARAQALQAELDGAGEALAAEVHERRRATGIAVRLKERVQRSEQLVANARSGRAAAEARVEELDAAIARMEAERERLRERRRRELEDARQHGLAPTLKELLPVLDHLEMAVAHASAEPDKLVEGVRMIVGQFGRALEARGVDRVDASAGTPFDPERHEALQRVESAAHPPGSVLDELRAGYTLNGRLLRAARVTVVAPPAAPPPEREPAGAPASETSGPADPAPGDAGPADPAPADPAPTDPAPGDAGPTDPAPGDEGPAAPAPGDAVPADPAPEHRA